MIAREDSDGLLFEPWRELDEHFSLYTRVRQATVVFRVPAHCYLMC